MNNIFKELNFMAHRDEPKNPTPAEKPEPNFDSNGVSRDLWPYRDEMKEWADTHLDDFGAFLQYKNAKFKLICGTGFYQQPGKNIISLSVPYYKECKEEKGMTIDQIFFASLHEFAHLKTMMELDRAGKRNHMQQFAYEKNKVIRDKENSSRFLSLGPTYREYYNIMEDAIVNRLVLNTSYYSNSDSGVSRERSEEITALYTDQIFVMRLEVGEGQGEYIKNPDEKADEAYIKVGPGKGNIHLVSKEDYEQGFDWNKAIPSGGRRGQFLTFFMKNQMIGLNPDDIYDEVHNPQGKHKLHPDAALALTRPLPEVYAALLQKVSEKYKDNPAQTKRYRDFMTQASRIDVFSERDGKIVAGEPDIVVNVCNSGAMDPDSLNVNLPLAKMQYLSAVKKVAEKIGRDSTEARSLTYFDVFDRYKDLTRSKEYSWTFPLKHNLLERSRMTREVLEPIFTMLCILDDSFDIESPDIQPSKSSSSKEKEKSYEKPDWQRGDKVINDDKSSPHFRQKGVITEITFDVNGKIQSVQVEYFESDKIRMAKGTDQKEVLSGEIEDVYDPDKNLILVQSGGETQQSDYKDKRKKEQEESEEEEEEEQQDDQEEEGDEDEVEDDEDLDTEDENGEAGEDGETGEEDEGEGKRKSKNKGKNKNKGQSGGSSSGEAGGEGAGEGQDGKDKEDKKDGQDAEGNESEQEQKSNKNKKNKPLDVGKDKKSKENSDSKVKHTLESLEEKYLKNLIEQDEREASLQETEKQKESSEYQTKQGDMIRAKQLLDRLRKEMKNSKQEKTRDDSNSLKNKELVAQYMELEKEIAPFSEQMAKNWLEIVNNIANTIEAARDKYYRSGKTDFKKLQKYFPEIEMGIDVDQRLIYERIVEKVVTDVKPQMLRVSLLIDNSDSMAGEKLRNMQMAIMLLNASLRSFRILFKDKMQEILGADYRPDFDLVCDTEIRLFGAGTSLVKSYKIQELAFLEDEKAERPDIDSMGDDVTALLAFKHMNANEGNTLDNKAWARIVLDHENETLRHMLRENRLTEVIFQVSDGEIADSEGTAISYIKALRSMGVGVGGFAMGSSEGGTVAFDALSKRHGSDNVINANTPSQIVKEFGKLLSKVITDKIETPMKEYLENIDKVV